MNLYELFILGVNIKYIVFSILYNVPMACKELASEMYGPTNESFCADALSQVLWPTVVVPTSGFVSLV